ncbi:MAG: hypothetical protein JWM84_3951 [Nocardioides sp.]|nr:hypothetical protein [Nocardioides sp.]
MNLDRPIRDRIDLPRRLDVHGTGAPRRRRVVLTLVGATAAAALLAACGTDSVDASAGAAAPSGTTTSTATSSSPSADAPTTEPPTTRPADDIPAFPTSTRIQTRRSPGGTPIVFTGLRTAAHDGFDRIVLEFSGTSTPGWAVTYVDDPALDGSGAPVRLGGDAFLDVYASNSTAPAPGYYSGPRRLDPQGDGAISGVFVGGTFEGTTQVLVGIDGDRVPFRVFALTAPSRLVVDVKT